MDLDIVGLHLSIDTAGIRRAERLIEDTERLEHAPAPIRWTAALLVPALHVSVGQVIDAPPDEITGAPRLGLRPGRRLRFVAWLGRVFGREAP